MKVNYNQLTLVSFLNIKESNQCDLAPSLICISMPLAFLFFMIFSYTTCETTPDLIFYIISITFEQSEVLASVYQPYLYLPRPVSRRHPMDIGRRAKQFAPFAALRGLDETVRQQEILYEPRKILSEEKQNELDMKLRILAYGMKIQATYFQKSWKNPLIGQYHTLSGTVEFFDPSVHLRIDDTEIQIQDICDLTGDVFETIEISC